MTGASWGISGQYYETCNCDYMCPCILSQMSVEPTKGDCLFVMGFRIDKGDFGSVSLDGLGFVVVGNTPGAMAKGNWSVGLIIDDRASAQQRDAIAAIASGSAGGPMSGLAGLIGNFLGVESAPIEFQSDGIKWSVKAAPKLDMAGQAQMGIDPNATGPLQLSNTGHPAANPVTLNRGIRSNLSALGFNWSDTSGNNAGLSAPFSWRGA
jgi:hypothetical protein